MSACVFFFGGYKASPDHVKAWKASAESQRSGVVFTAYAWPPRADSSDTSAVENAKKDGLLDEARKAIKASRADKIYVVGHSSGCAIANAVDRDAVDKGIVDKDRIVLVVLDGFKPDKEQRERKSSQFWSAEWKGALSLNYRNLQRAVGDRLGVYRAPGCTSVWPLHFSLVNVNASDSTVNPKKYLATGYTDCRANLMFLPSPTG